MIEELQLFEAAGRVDKSKKVGASKRAVEELKERVVAQGAETLCSICCDYISPGSPALTMPCDHEYHPECLKHWL